MEIKPNATIQIRGRMYGQSRLITAAGDVVCPLPIVLLKVGF
jgi:hypothetical protein